MFVECSFPLHNNLVLKFKLSNQETAKINLRGKQKFSFVPGKGTVTSIQFSTFLELEPDKYSQRAPCMVNVLYKRRENESWK